MIRTVLAITAIATIANVAHAQSAPGLSNGTYGASQSLYQARTEALNTAANAEQRLQSLAAQRAQLRILEAEALAASRPTMYLDTGGPTPMSFSMPTGNGLVPGGTGETNYHLNIQVGQGNASAINTTNMESRTVLSGGRDTTEDSISDVEE